MASTISYQLPRSWTEHFDKELRNIEKASLTRSVITPEEGPEPRVSLHGGSFLLFTSNNYLGLSTHPQVIQAAIEATQRYGASVSASRLLCGSTPLHEELESRLAGIKGQEACLLYSSGYLANLGAITALTGPGDVVFSDQLNHASIIDGCRLARATVAVYRHRDLDHLEGLLRKTDARRKLIISESVFSMDGDLAPVPDLLALADRYGAVLFLDEAHSTGVLGQDGAGALSHFHISTGPVMVMGTLSKALGSIGGFVASSKAIVSYLQNRSRSFIFNTALPPGAAGATLKAIELLTTESWRQKHVLALAAALRDALTALGYPPTHSVTPIVPLMLGDTRTSIRMEAWLRADGVLARAIRPPTVPEGTSRIRFNIMATHSESDVRRVAEIVSSFTNE